jgi:hypothetical protein
MKATGLFLAVALVLATIGAALAQSTPSDSRATAPPSNTGVDVNAGVRTNDKGADVNAGVDRTPDARDDRADGSASPRTTAPPRTTVFGLSPAGAIVIAAALLVVVILAIVAMARSGDRTTYVERDRRL